MLYEFLLLLFLSKLLSRVWKSFVYLHIWKIVCDYWCKVFFLQFLKCSLRQKNTFFNTKLTCLWDKLRPFMVETYRDWRRIKNVSACTLISYCFICSEYFCFSCFAFWKDLIFGKLFNTCPLCYFSARSHLLFFFPNFSLQYPFVLFVSLIFDRVCPRLPS